MKNSKRTLHTSLSPALLQQQNVKNSVLVIIDVLRATSTIASSLFNGAKCIIPVDSVSGCIEWGTKIDCIMAGERDGRIAEGLQYGNSPFEYPKEFINGKTLVLTTTNGTKLLHMALERGASNIITGSFPNLSAVCDHLISQDKHVILGCAGWKDRVNLEDTLFAGAVIARVKDHFDIDCDSSTISEILYQQGKADLFSFMKRNNASHYRRLSGYGLDKDIEFCLTPDVANVLPVYNDGQIIAKR